MPSLPWQQPVQDEGEADEHWFLRFIASTVEHTKKEIDNLMAITDQLVADVATLKADADSAAARDAAAMASLQSTVDNLNAQVATLTADQADPAVIAQLDADIQAIDGVINGIAAAPAPAPSA